MPHRRSLNGLSTADRQKLGDFILAFLNHDIVHGHMDIDHMGRFFSHHRSYIWILERAILEQKADDPDFVRTVVPLPDWDPTSRLLKPFNKVKGIHGEPDSVVNPLYNLERRTLVLPANLAFSEIRKHATFPTAEDLAIALGRTFESAPTSFHANSHRMLGPVMWDMMTAASAVIFWPQHAFFEEMYHEWQIGKLKPIRSPVAGRHGAGNGRLEVFVIGVNNEIWHAWQDAPNGEWSGRKSLGWSHWESFDGKAKQIAVGNNPDGRLEVFVIGMDDRLWHRWVQGDNTWSGWQVLAGGVLRQIAVTNGASGRLEVFAIQAGAGRNKVWRLHQTGPASWSDSWEELTVPHQQQVVALRDRDGGNGRVHIFTRRGGRVSHQWQLAPNGIFSTPSDLGGVFSQLVAATNQDNRLEVFGIGTDQRLWHRYVRPGLNLTDWSGQNIWSNWESLGPADQGLRHIAVGKNPDGRLEIFAAGLDGKAWHIWQVAPNRGWSDWSPFPDLRVMGSVNQVTVGTNADGRLELFGTASSDGLLWRIWQENPGAGPWVGWLLL